MDARGDHHGRGLDVRAVGELGARHAVVLHAQARHAAVADIDRLVQGGDEAARVDRVVARDVEREPHGRGERRLGAARLARAQPRDVQAERLAERDQPVERLRLVGVARDDERAVAAQAGVAPGDLGQLGAEGLEGAALRSPSSSSACSPNSASATGASMPAATCHAPGSPASMTTARSPRRVARHAHARPIGPPPTTATS